MNFIRTIKSHPFLFSVLLLSVAFLFSRGPFFLWLCLPEVGPDSFDYTKMSQVFLFGSLKELGQQPVELPPGLSVFLIAAGFITSKLTGIIILQNFIKLFSCLYLVYEVCKYYKKWGIAVAFALCIYVANSFTIRLDTAVYTESLYSSALIVLVGLLIKALHKNSTLNWLAVGVWLFVPEFIRPNGVYVYFIIGLLFVFFYRQKEPLKKYVAIVLPALLFNLVWIGFNGAAYGVYMPGNFIRLAHVMNNGAQPTPEQVATLPTEKKSLGARLNFYTTLQAEPQFYYSLWATRYENMYIKNQVHDREYKMYDWTVPVPDDLRQITYKEFYTLPDAFKVRYDHLKEHHGLIGLWLGVYQIWYKLEQLLLRNRLVFILFFIITIYACVKWLRSGFRSRMALIITVTGALHVLSIIVVALAHPSTQLRYGQVSEFAVFLTFALTPLLFTESDSQEKYAQQ